MIRTLVADDEPIARHSVTRLLREDPEIAVLGEYGDGAGALEAIQQLDPDLVFLDIRMPELSGIDVAGAIGETPRPAIVFVTAYEDFAVRAFEANAVDYVVKPFSRERFNTTLQRAKRRLVHDGEGVGSQQILRALADLRRERQYVRRIPVPVDEHIILIEIGAIDWIEADRNRVRLHSGATSHELRETMAALETRLDPNRFLRVHRSAIVNIDRIKAIHPWFNGYHLIELTTGKRLRMSRYQRDSFLRVSRLVSKAQCNRVED